MLKILILTDSTMWEATTGAMNEISLHFQQKRLHEHVSSTTDAQLPIKERVELLKFLMTYVSEEKKIKEIEHAFRVTSCQH